MKRSEMIQIIKKAADHQISREQAESILSFQEKIGMLPPTISESVTVLDDSGKVHSMQQYENKWETED